VDATRFPHAPHPLAPGSQTVSFSPNSKHYGRVSEQVSQCPQCRRTRSASIGRNGRLASSPAEVRSPYRTMHASIRRS
jgi:hypothetical protein